MRVRHGFLVALVALSSLHVGIGSALAEVPPSLPTPGFPPVPPVRTRLRTNSVVYPPVAGAPTFSSLQPAITTPDAFKIDAKEKVVNVKAGEPDAKFSFAVTNVSKQDAVIMSVHTSCGCTAAKLPSTPWVLKPGEGGEIGVTMNLAGKFGVVTKTVTVVTSAGSIPLLVK
ncbi:MAG: DUF1573 domain-containing protein, partial [Verrucomicrobia bacterium]